MTTAEMIRIACVRRGNISEAELARRLEKSPQALNNKMKRETFSVKDMQEIAEALQLKCEVSFIDPETGERIVSING